jgi:hypothetical protein
MAANLRLGADGVHRRHGSAGWLHIVVRAICLTTIQGTEIARAARFPNDPV